MILSYEYGTEIIEFTVIYRKRKTLSIKIEAPRIITVIAPMGLSEEKIIELVKTKSKWVVKKLFDMEEMQYLRKDKQYINGESFSYMGRNYSLQIVFDQNKITPEGKLDKGKIYVYTNNNDEDVIKGALINLYMEKAKENIEERIEYYQPYFDLKPSKIIIKDQKKCWGSCNRNRELRFNFRCIMTPSTVLDYIVVHEMCHMVHMNHSKDFWNLVESILPDYKERRQLLKNTEIKYEV